MSRKGARFPRAVSRLCRPASITLRGPSRRRKFRSTGSGRGGSLTSTRRTIRGRSKSVDGDQGVGDFVFVCRGGGEKWGEDLAGFFDGLAECLRDAGFLHCGDQM